MKMDDRIPRGRNINMFNGVSATTGFLYDKAGHHLPLPLRSLILIEPILYDT
jgi:hypothetical protein